MNDDRLRRHPLGFLEVIDRPTEQELTEYYTKLYYQTEQANYRSSYPPLEVAMIRQRISQRVHCAEQLRGSEGPGRLLDVGCGEGFVMATLADQGWAVEGLDHTLVGVKAMNPKVAPYVDAGNVFSLLQERIDQGCQYELVWLGHVLEHVLDPVGLLQSIHRLVDPDGLLIATVPNDGNAYHEGLLDDGLISERFWIAPPDHLSYFTAESLTLTAEATGWRCLDILADFPIDIFLSHPGSNYVQDRAQGPQAHAARLRLEEAIGSRGIGPANDLYRALAGVGLGRNLTAYLSPKIMEK